LIAEPSRLGVGDSLAHASPLSEASLYRCKAQLPKWGERVGLLFARGSIRRDQSLANGKQNDPSESNRNPGGFGPY
jgi:hypothetical protein